MGREDGHRVGWLEVGADVGLLVSPGLVGRDVAGDLVGRDVGDVLVGIDVGADTIIAWPTTTAASLIEDIDFFASGVSRSSAPTEAAARSNSLEKLPDETEAVTLSEIDFVRSSSAVELPLLASSVFVTANEIDVLGAATGAEVGVPGIEIGAREGFGVGALVGGKVGLTVGLRVGETVGFGEGFGVGNKDGFGDGERVGESDGFGDGANDGAKEGATE